MPRSGSFTVELVLLAPTSGTTWIFCSCGFFVPTLATDLSSRISRLKVSSRKGSKGTTNCSTSTLKHQKTTFVDKNDFAMDISFGSTGYSLILARAFKDVLSLNFDPFYANDKEVFHLEQFHADYCTVRFQENVLTKGTAKLNKLEEGLSKEFDGPYPDLEGSKKWLNLVLVGPFTDDGKIATVNLFLERQKNAVRYARHCILMYIRPMKIGPRDVADKFCTFTPPEDYFKKSGNGEKLRELGFVEKILAKKNSATSPDGVFIVACEEIKKEHHILVNAKCHETQCQFEITLFEYCGPLAEERGPNLPPAPNNLTTRVYKNVRLPEALPS
ncbi:hypothetical protein GBAR_LOCUS26977 [Geodia barretti]|uniref:Uncharacterized protein n=1 Tax=Geodia barretti TaxID=519541 RepID=A0AA35X997_GEOBA|nr:hypothetical protein GBAR_LOCUS26977 [Geodia barretti]